MIRFFRVNDPYRLVLIFLLLIFIRIGQSYFISDVSYYELKFLLLGQWLGKGFSLYSTTFDYTSPLAAFIYKYIDLFFGRSVFLHHILSSLIIIFQAGIFNQILLRNNAYDENSYLPAFLYVILMTVVPDFMAVSPQLLSLTFVLLTLRNVLRRIDNEVTDELFLISGLFIGIATMIYLPSAVFFIVFLVALILFSTTVIRRLMLYFFGFFLVFVLCTLYFYRYGIAIQFLQSFIVGGLIQPASDILSSRELFILSSPFLFIFLLSVVKTWGSAKPTNFQQKIQQVIWLMFCGGIVALLLSKEKNGYEFVFAVPVTAYFWTYYFILLRRRFFKVIMPAVLIFGVISFSCYAYFRLTDSLIAISQKNVKNKVMILGEQLEYYKEVEISTPCFNEYLCKKAFEGFKYYKTASQLYEMIERTDPNFIVDEMNVAPELFHRFPTIEKRYVLISENIYKKAVNN